jgi:predicted Zn-dependent peptidase
MVEFKRVMLENGLTILHEKRELAVSTIMLAVKYGSAYENDKEKGMSHFIEHMCFKGTEKRTMKQISSEIEKVGGMINAFTGEEVTNFHAKIPSEHLDVAAGVLFDIFFNSVFPDDELKKEAKVVCEEIKMYKDNPRLLTLRRIKECLYEKPFGDFIAGNEKNVLSFSRELLLKKYKEVYCPENAILCVVGNNSIEEIIDLAKKLCSNRKCGKKSKMIMPVMRRKNFLETRKTLEQANAVLGVHLPYDYKNKYAGEILNAILGSGMSSRLFTEVRDKRGLVYTVHSECDFGAKYGYMMIYFGTSKKNLEVAKKVCIEEFNKVRSLTQQELSDIKEQLVGNLRLNAEASEETANALVHEEVRGRAEEHYEYEQKIRAVDLKDVQNLTKNKKFVSAILSP